MHRCCVYTKICIRTLGIYYFVFLEGLCFLYLFYYTLFTVSRLVLFSESEGWKQIISNEESNCKSCRKFQVSKVRRATSRHAAGNLWPPRPRIHMISLRPSSTFTVLAISNVEMWRCLWLKLDSTARAAETLVFRRGYGGTQRFILLYTMWVS